MIFDIIIHAIIKVAYTQTLEVVTENPRKKRTYSNSISQSSEPVKKKSSIRGRSTPNNESTSSIYDTIEVIPFNHVSRLTQCNTDQSPSRRSPNTQRISKDARRAQHIEKCNKMYRLIKKNMKQLHLFSVEVEEILADEEKALFWDDCKRFEEQLLELVEEYQKITFDTRYYNKENDVFTLITKNNKTHLFETCRKMTDILNYMLELKKLFKIE